MSDPLTLPARLDLSAVTQLVTDLRAMEGDIRVDASEVSHLGALCLQALIAASRQAHANGHIFEISGASEKVVGQMQFMGLAPQQLMEGSV